MFIYFIDYLILKFIWFHFKDPKIHSKSNPINNKKIYNHKKINDKKFEMLTKGINKMISMSNNKKIKVIRKNDKEKTLREDKLDLIPHSNGLSI